MTTRDEALNFVSSTPAVLETLLRLLDEKTAGQALDNGWSAKDVVAHLVLTERLGWVARIRLVQTNDRPLLPFRDEDAELRSSGLRSRPAIELLQVFVSARHENVEWLRSLNPEDFARKGRHSEVGDVSAEELLFHGAYHDALHLGQFLAMLQGFYEPFRGVMRAY